MNTIAQNFDFSNVFFNKPSLNDVIFKTYEYSKELSRQSIADIFVDLDDRFFKSKLWKKEYKNHGFVNRVLITSIGIIQFKRRYYKSINKELNSNFYFVDSFFEMPKYSRITSDAMCSLTKMATEVNASYASCNALVDCVVSRQSVSNILKSFITSDMNIPRIPEIIEKKNEEKETIYIELDEAHCNLQLKGKETKISKNKIAKLALVHTGHIHLTYASKRKELQNKHYFGDLNSQITDYCDRIYSYITSRYNPDRIKNIFVSGDGAKWINSFSQNLRDCFRYNDIIVTQVLDKFHLRKRLNSIFSKNDQLIKLVLNNLNSLNEASFRSIAYDFYENKPDHKLNPNVFDSHVRFICDNFEYIKNNNHPMYKTPCSMEGHISHVYASRLTSRPKGFSINTLESLMHLLVFKANLRELTVQDIIAWRKPIAAVKNIRNQRANKMITRMYDNNINLEINKSTNTKMKDYINRLTSAKWDYSR